MSVLWRHIGHTFFPHCCTLFWGGETLERLCQTLTLVVVCRGRARQSSLSGFSQDGFHLRGFELPFSPTERRTYPTQNLSSADRSNASPFHLRRKKTLRWPSESCWPFKRTFNQYPHRVKSLDSSPEWAWTICSSQSCLLLLTDQKLPCGGITRIYHLDFCWPIPKNTGPLLILHHYNSYPLYHITGSWSTKLQTWFTTKPIMVSYANYGVRLYELALTNKSMPQR